ncbi:hypothetical protein LSCM1_04260 [Leishmania martiniquensis]|uniref:Uncharacterized protein n=1 Tax=Leishmania martiniquensis TaxID=1580590 RepID=A0A836HGS1_9TRYP|nr:hypothetical protein LSCM1_04260 [Leishmania martiniquensis]
MRLHRRGLPLLGVTARRTAASVGSSSASPAGGVAAWGHAQTSFSTYALAASAGMLYALFYFTTYTYVLTTNTSPHHHSLFFHFPCDMAIIENRITRRRRIVQVVPEAASPGRPCDNGHEEAGQTGLTHPQPAIAERRLRINSMLYRVLLYLQKTESFVTVDAQAEMLPFRFMEGASSIGKDSRASVGFLREDQLLPDTNDDRAGTASSQRWRWLRPGSGATRRAAQLPQPLPGSGSCDPNAAAASAPTRILLKSSVRLRDAVNGYEKGCKGAYERFVQHVAQEKIKQRYHDYVLARGMAENSGLRKVYAEELIRNGLLSGDGVTLTELVPDAQQFAHEVFEEVKAKFGDAVIVYECLAAVW